MKAGEKSINPTTPHARGSSWITLLLLVEPVTFRHRRGRSKVESQLEEASLKIFLGYPSEYRTAAKEIYNFLRTKGDEIWFDRKSLVAGDDWDSERDRAQREADLVVHLCSAAILERPGVVNREIKQTLRLVDDQPFGALYVVPIRLEPIKLPVELTRFQYLDYFDDNWKEPLSTAVEKRRSQLLSNIGRSSQTHVTQETKTGFQKVEFEETSKTYECRGEYISYNESGIYWTLVNGAIAAHALEGFFGNANDFRRLAAEEAETQEFDEDQARSEWSIRADEFYRFHDLTSVRFYTFINYAGAIHPNHYITSLNFFGAAVGPVSIEEMLDYSIENASKILEHCEKVIVASLDEQYRGEGDFFEGYKDAEENVWSLLSQFNFNAHEITFNFSPYKVLPYVFSLHEVHVPWSFLDGMLSERIRPVIRKLIG